MSGVRHITVKEDDDGQRLDRWLKRYVPELPFGLAQKLIRKGQLRVDGKRAKTDTRLGAGQDVRIPPVEGEGAKSARKKKISQEDAAFIRSLVIYDDGDVLAINKPYGLATQGGSKVERNVDDLMEALADKDGVKPRLVHRLDKDTSGVMILARSAKVAKALGDTFKGRDIKKIYWAICSPAPEIQEGFIKAPIHKIGTVGREHIVVDEEGKFAHTEYTVVENAYTQAAFVAFWPRTGRTHQIRVHAAFMGFGVLGDPKYRAKPDPESKLPPPDFSQMKLADRLHLHAQRIICPHPVKKGMLDIAAPLPPELAKSWKEFGFNAKYKGDPFEGVEV